MLYHVICTLSSEITYSKWIVEILLCMICACESFIFFPTKISHAKSDTSGIPIADVYTYIVFAQRYVDGMVWHYNILLTQKSRLYDVVRSKRKKSSSENFTNTPMFHILLNINKYIHKSLNTKRVHGVTALNIFRTDNLLCILNVWENCLFFDKYNFK